ncbi:DUF3168 domain-containing protein [Aeribacillus pallidus]|jgi:Protein of unknown function (DUF3168)|uniref:tail completion protein gp17 n=1 Tax=Aeribacillus composti TaxID=1868734 RepID=UPI002E1F952C|nr:DUF3168 domain-containing protein [Aeribacillus composti]MED4488165.1 DUF3168 domain-containing protein [Aeribacillus pallidus]
MSFDATAELLAGLKANQTLVSLCTGGFHNRKAKDVNAFPRIVFTEINNADDSFADNKAITSEARFQISIFTNESTVSKETPIAKEVDKAMKSLGYSRYSSVSLYEEDEKVFHKAMRYQKIFF